jgi:hypothetical protein
VTHDPTDVALLDAHQAEADEKAKVERLTEVGDFKWIVSNKRGRRYMYRTLEQAGVFQLSFTGDPYTTAFNEGRRNPGLAVLAMFMEHAPESYALMLSERNDRTNIRNTDR